MKLSIITINLNNKDGLRKTIESVVNQTFDDYEFIVIDGASTDGSVEVIKEYESKIAYWVSELDKGIYNAMNKGILKAKGEYCLFLNSGDTLYKNDVLQEIFSYNPTEDLFWGKLYNDKTVYPSVIVFSFMFGWSLPHPATFIKRELFNKISLYDETYRIISDWAFFMKAIYMYGCSYLHIPLTVTKFDNTGISSSENSKQIIHVERKSFFEENFPLYYEDYQRLYRISDELSLIKKSRMYKYFVYIRKFLGKPV